jgi:hypothetical protein
MSNKSKILFSINLKNIGPFRSLSAKMESQKLQLGIFAPNGTGKTFITRAFSLLSNNNAAKNYNDYLTIGTNEGEISINIEDIKENKRLIAVAKIGKDILPDVSNNTNYIFRVFNSDYVIENLEMSGYKPNGEIEGYILGKGVIDLNSEKTEKNTIEHKIQESKIKINQIITAGIAELDKLNINKRTTEYQNISFANIYSGIKQENVRNLNDLIREYQSVNSLPDDYHDIARVTIPFDIDFLNSIDEFLDKKFDKSTLAVDFKEMVKNKISFVSGGVQLFEKQKNNTCPFCGQSLNQDALALIDEYNKYLNDSEGKIFTQIETFKTNLKQFGDNIKTTSMHFWETKGW